MYEFVPNELKELKQWVCYTDDKMPKNAYTGGNAQSNNKSTWSDFNTAVAAVKKYGFAGVGFMFAPPYFGVDLDKCLDEQDFIDEFVETLQSYTEISKSKNGIHIICKGKLPDGNRRRGKVEMYSEARYFIVTGNRYSDKYSEIVDCTETIKPLHAKYLADTTPKVAPKRVQLVDLSDTEIVDKARSCKTGFTFEQLYRGNWEAVGVFHSQSEADLSFCMQLAFWTQRNRQQMDRIFRSSGLYRKKWDEKRGSLTYGEKTIEKAVTKCTTVYEPTLVQDEKDLAINVFGNDDEIQINIPKKAYDLTDTGNAQRFRDKYHGNVKYSFVNKKWYFWTGKVWQVDYTGEIKKLADEVIEDIKKAAFEEKDGDQQEAILKWAKNTSSSNRKEAMIKEAQHLTGIPILPEEMDAYSDYLNCQNGIINLRNGELLPHNSEFNMSSISYCEYDYQSDRKPERWLAFLNDVTNGDQKLIDYLQKCVGYSLSGSVKEQCLFFLYGIGQNGKSTFLDIVSELLGTYSAMVQPETIMLRKQSDSSANSDIARLKSKRFVVSEEPTEGVRLNEGLVKQLTGGGKVTCRFLYGDEFEYAPEFKIWIGTNHKPVIRGTDVGIWRRIRLIPFEVTIPQEKVDKNLKWKLRKELPQILKWAVEGCIKWQKEGLELPDAVEQATKDYKNEMDVLTTFIDACIVIDYAQVGISANELFSIYSNWAKSNNEFEMSSRKFFLEIAKRLPDKKRTGGGMIYTGIVPTEYARQLRGSQKNFNSNDIK